MRDTQWLQRAAAALTVMLKPLKTKMVSFPDMILVLQHININTSALIVLHSAVKKKYGAGLKFSNLMNIGKKKPSAFESPEKSVNTSGRPLPLSYMMSGYVVESQKLNVTQVQVLPCNTVLFVLCRWY